MDNEGVINEGLCKRWVCEYDTQRLAESLLLATNGSAWTEGEESVLCGMRKILMRETRKMDRKIEAIRKKRKE